METNLNYYAALSFQEYKHHLAIGREVQDYLRTAPERITVRDLVDHLMTHPDLNECERWTADRVKELVENYQRQNPSGNIFLPILVVKGLIPLDVIEGRRPANTLEYHVFQDKQGYNTGLAPADTVVVPLFVKGDFNGARFYRGPREIIKTSESAVDSPAPTPPYRRPHQECEEAPPKKPIKSLRQEIPPTVHPEWPLSTGKYDPKPPVNPVFPITAVQYMSLDIVVLTSAKYDPVFDPRRIKFGDDYIPQPLKPEELDALLRAIKKKLSKK